MHAQDDYDHLRESADAAWRPVSITLHVRTEQVSLILIETDGAIEVRAWPRLGGFEIETASDTQGLEHRTPITARPVPA